jgi:hypothetical protein
MGNMIARRKLETCLRDLANLVLRMVDTDQGMLLRFA